MPERKVERALGTPESLTPVRRVLAGGPGKGLRNGLLSLQQKVEVAWLRSHGWLGGKLGPFSGWCCPNARATVLGDGLGSKSQLQDGLALRPLTRHFASCAWFPICEMEVLTGPSRVGRTNGIM